MGLYEYMLLADELGAEPIYVVNNGISHQQSTPLDQLGPFLEETLQAICCQNPSGALKLQKCQAGLVWEKATC